MPPTGITTDRPEPLNHEKAPVSMSQPLRSSRARNPSSRYTAVGPPPWNCTGISRPIDGDGTVSTSGASALAVTGSAMTLTRPAKKTNANMALVNRRGHNFSRENRMALVHPAPQPCSPTCVVHRLIASDHHLLRSVKAVLRLLKLYCVRTSKKLLHPRVDGCRPRDSGRRRGDRAEPIDGAGGLRGGAVADRRSGGGVQMDRRGEQRGPCAGGAGAGGGDRRRGDGRDRTGLRPASIRRPETGQRGRVVRGP